MDPAADLADQSQLSRDEIIKSQQLIWENYKKQDDIISNLPHTLKGTLKSEHSG